MPHPIRATPLWQIDIVAALYVSAHYGDEPDARYARAHSIVRQLEAEGKLTPELRAQLD